VLVPGIRALFLEPANDVSQRFEIFEARAARVTIKDDDGHAPEALARNGPVRALRDHVVHAVFAPGGNPLHVADLVESFLAETGATAVGGGVNLDKPLLGGAENHGIVAPPAMRIAVLVLVVAEQRAAFGR